MNDDTDAYIAITRLQSSYADVVTRRAWPELTALFEPDAPIHIDTVTRPAINVTGPVELGQFIGRALERFDFFEFVILNTCVEVVDDGTATGRLYIEEVRHQPEPEGWSHAYGLYRDSYAKRDGRWRFAERSYRSLARRHAGGSEVVSAAGDVGRQ